MSPNASSILSQSRSNLGVIFMTTSRKSVFLLAAAAALLAAQASPVIHSSTATAPKAEVGGLTAVLAEASWHSCRLIDSLEYRDESVSPSALSHDELFYRVALRNLLPVPRTFKISASANRSADSCRIVTLEPMSTATVTLPLAFAHENRTSGYHFTISEPNPPAASSNGENDEIINLSTHSARYEPHGADPNLLLSDGITRDSILPSFRNDFNTVELRRKAEDWPRDFRAYLPFDAVCLAKTVASSLSDDTRSALRAFELLGGKVMTMEDGALHPKDIESQAKSAMGQRIGDLDVSHYYYRYSSRSKFSDNVAKVPIQVGRSLPVGILIAFLALVAIVVMPATVWYCARKNRRLFLLAALPGSALALTIVVALVALAAYGTTPTVRVQAVTILDPESRLAVSRGQFAVFAPGQVSRNMSIPSDASFRLRGRQDGYLVVRCGETFRLEGEWIKPLSAAFFDFERAERRSERLEVKRGADGNISVANLLGLPIVGGQLQLDGQRYKIPPLAPGEETSVAGTPFAALSAKHLRSPAEELAAAFFGKSADYGRNWSKTLEIADGERTAMPDGTYIVRLTGSPFFPSPLAETKSYETAEAVVAGCVAPEGGKETAK